jgi:hypothetical protein
MLVKQQSLVLVFVDGRGMLSGSATAPRVYQECESNAASDRHVALTELVQTTVARNAFIQILAINLNTYLNT